MPVLTLCLMLAAASAAADPTASLKPGKATLSSAGPLAFGPGGVLFVGDALGATIWALDTGDRTAASGQINVGGLHEKSRRGWARRRTRSRSTT